MELWLVGQYKQGSFPGIVWDYQGVFDCEELALAACKDYTYFINPIELNKELPKETVKMPKVYYPLCTNYTEGKNCADYNCPCVKE